jgi:hypothetical protein
VEAEAGGHRLEIKVKSKLLSPPNSSESVGDISLGGTAVVEGL